MRYFLDTEFIDRPDEAGIDLLTIALVSEDGRELYLGRRDEYASWSMRVRHANDFVRQHVLPQLPLPENAFWVNRHELVRQIDAFIGADPHPVFIGYYADYDWVAFCHLYGEMVQLPERFPKYCRDLKQWADDLDHRFPPQPKEGEHNALVDARWIRGAYWVLKGFHDDLRREIAQALRKGRVTVSEAAYELLHVRVD